MAHVDPPVHLQNFERFQLFGLGLEVGETTYVIERTGDEVVFTRWARFRGRFTIPRLKQVVEYDNTKALEQDVQTWLNSLMGKKNTTNIPLVEPTIRLPRDVNDNVISWDPVISVPAIEGAYLALGVDESATNNINKSIGDVMFVGNPQRLYQLAKVEGTKWLLTPSLLPMGDASLLPINSVFKPAPATTLKVRVLTQTTQTRAKAGRGPWNVEVVEVIV